MIEEGNPFLINTIEFSQVIPHGNLGLLNDFTVHVVLLNCMKINIGIIHEELYLYSVFNLRILQDI